MGIPSGKGDEAVGDLRDCAAQAGGAGDEGVHLGEVPRHGEARAGERVADARGGRVPRGKRVAGGEVARYGEGEQGGDGVGVGGGVAPAGTERAPGWIASGGSIGEDLVADLSDEVAKGGSGQRLTVAEEVADGIETVGAGRGRPTAGPCVVDWDVWQVGWSRGARGGLDLRVVRRKVGMAAVGLHCDDCDEAGAKAPVAAGGVDHVEGDRCAREDAPERGAFEPRAKVGGAAVFWRAADDAWGPTVAIYIDGEVRGVRGAGVENEGGDEWDVDMCEGRVGAWDGARPDPRDDR